MQIPSYERLYELTCKLCRVPSVTGQAAQENACAELLRKELSSIASVKAWTFPCENDALGRQAVMAFLPATTETKRTILLTGHFDVVDTDMCGALGAVAFDLPAYTEALKSEALDAAAKKDLDSGNWLFGRGSMDMKAGHALFIEEMRAQASAERNINLLYLAVPDEEGSSAGMRGSLGQLNRFIQAHGLKVVAAFSGEPCFWTEAGALPAVRPYSTGSTGKLMPFFYVKGRAAHVGNCFEGISAAQVLGEIVSRAETDPRLLDGRDYDLLSPPVCLGMQVRRQTYSVTVTDRAVAFFNVLFADRGAQEVLDWALTVANEATRAAYQKRELARSAHQRRGGASSELAALEVLTTQAVVAQAVKVLGLQAYEAGLSQYLDGLKALEDVREKSICALEWTIAQIPDFAPAVIVGFLPPYYPARVNRRRTPEELALRAVCEAIALKAGQMAGDGATVAHEVFGGISDLSFLGAPERSEELDFVGAQMPGGKDVYWIPADELSELDIPVVNMGPAGRAAHQKGERLELDFSFRVAPRLLREAIERLSQ